MIKKLSLLIVIVCTSILGVNAQGLDMQAPIPADPAVRVGKLDNGMTYYIRHNAKPEKQGEFYIFHNVGAIQEEDSQIGLAHFLEHMAFNGTKNLPDKQLINYLETIGVKFGANLNAGTGQDMTVYNMSSVPLTREGIIDSALLILHDWSYFVTLDPKEIDKERGVIIEELRTGDNAQFRVREKYSPVLFNNSKYAYRNVIGNQEALRNFSHQELVDFYHRWYRTDQQALVVVGDFDVDKMEAKIKKVMADIPKAENPAQKLMVKVPDNQEPLVSVVTDPELSTTMVEMYIKREPLPTMLNDKIIAEKINVIMSFISQMANYRLYEISQKPNAPFVNAGIGQRAITATVDVIMARAVARNGEAAKAFESLYSEVEKIRRFGFTDTEVERVKSELMRSSQQQYDNRNDKRSGQYVWQYINNFRQNSAMPSSEVEWKIDSALIASINIMEINAIAQGLITPMNQVVIVSSPEKEGIAVPSSEDIQTLITKVRGSELEAYADNSVKEPLIATELKGSKVKKTESNQFGATVWTLANGARVVVKPTNFKADEVLISVNAPGGLSLVADEDYLSAEMLSTFMQVAGIGKFSAVELGKQLSGKAVEVQPALKEYEAGVAAMGSPKDLETMLQLVYLNLTSPRLDEGDFNMMKDKYKAILANASSNPDYVMKMESTKTMYGNNPRRQMISSETMEKVEFAKMSKVFNQIYGNPANMTYTIVGNVELETIKPLIEKYIGSLPATKVKATLRDDNAAQVKGEVKNRFAVEMKSPKTTVMYSYAGEIPFTLENSLTFSALRQILSIRYTESIREEKGGTYGVRVAGELSGEPKDKYQFKLQFDTDPAMADELMELIDQEMVKIAQNGPKTEDLSKIKEFIMKQRPDDLKRNEVWLNYIDSYYVNDIDLNKDYDKLLSELSAAKIQAMAAQIIKDNNIVRVIMDPKK